MTLAMWPLQATGVEELSTTAETSRSAFEAGQRVTSRPRGVWQERLRREICSLRSGFQPRLWLFGLLARLLPAIALPTIRTQLLRWAGCRIAPGAAVLGRLSLAGTGPIARRLTIGAGSIIAPDALLGLDADITLGRNVSVGPQVTLYTATHALGFGSRRMNPAMTARPIVVEDGAWIGMQSLVLPGVTLGHGCVVSAGSVVTEDVPPDTLVAGNPAVPVQKLPFGHR